MPFRPCSVCGDMRYATASSRPEIICHPCRRARRTPPQPVASCAACGQPAFKVYCSRSCANRATGDKRRASNADPDAVANKWARKDRERHAPGLGYAQRTRLLALWKRQGRRCAYCPSAATTIDHVVPLVKGGTNHEGNLAPACRSCNSSKCDRLIVEWRHLQAPDLRR